jgi:gliding motility-associated-like protein
MQYMKRVLPLIFISLFLTSFLSGQTVFYTENFTTAGAGWTFNTVTGPEGADPNFWKSSAEEGGGLAPGACGVANNANNTLFVTSVFAPTGGAAYDAGGLCGVLFCPQADRRTESPIINCTGKSTITLNFNYIEGGDALNDNATVWYNDGTGFVLLDDPAKTAVCGGGQGKWTAYSFALPASADNNPLVQIAFRWVNNDDGVGTDPSFAVDDITLTVPLGAVPVVTITPTPNDTICQNATLTLSGSASNGPITTWAWTANPAAGVVFTPNAAAQNPTVTFTTAGTYTFTLDATNASGTGTTTQTITVLPMVTPSVAMSGPVGTICSGANICFTVVPTNGGTAPTYTWDVNGVGTGNTTTSFCSSTLNNNDVVNCTMTSNALCTTTNTVVASFTVSITPTVVPSVTIAADNNSVCAGTTVNFTATPTNGGATPSYSWSVNGNPAGLNSPNFSSTFTNGDAVSVILTSNAVCVSPATATSNTITITVTPTVVPAVVLTPDVSNPVCVGTSVTFTATPTNGGAAPTYQWAVNGFAAGSNSTIFGPTVFANGDVVTLTMTSNAVCVTPSTVAIVYTVQVTAPSAPTVTVTPNPASACSGSSITFTATPTNGGAAPSYQWVVNGVNAGANTSTFTLSSIVGGELVSVILTSNGTCITTPTANSNTVTVGITPSPTTSITHGTATVCPGTADTLIVKATAGSTFSWTPSAGLNATANDSVIATNAAVGVYTYYVTATKSGCTHTDSVIVTVSNALVATAGPNATICAGQSAPLSVVGGIKWSWLPTGTTCDTCKNTVATPTATTIYTVTASNGGCFSVLNETITVIPNASISFITSVTTQGIPQTISFTNTTTNANSYYWTFDTDPINSVMQNPAPHVYPAEGTYTVTLIAYGNNGCNDTSSTVLIVVDTVGINFPNIFTPNGDEINDVWQPNAHGMKDLECTIYDRWGLKVYEFVGPQDKWDGHTTAGLMCKNGTYYYILKATDNNNKSYEKTGFIQLIH